MKTISLLGDIHGDVRRLRLWAGQNKNCDLLIHVGDCGFGFRTIPILGNKVKLLRGNHDSPLHARNHPNYIGDWGYNREYNLFYLGGAWSIDWQWRTPMKNWWPDEQLSEAEFEKAFALYQESKPKIVVTHDCPASAYPEVMSLGLGYIPSLTSEQLQRFFEAHKPEVWLFGHHHQSKSFVVERTLFRCLGIGESASWEIYDDEHETDL